MKLDRQALTRWITPRRALWTLGAILVGALLASAPGPFLSMFFTVGGVLFLWALVGFVEQRRREERFARLEHEVAKLKAAIERPREAPPAP